MVNLNKKKVPVDCYSRVVGYYSVVNKDWNKGKREEKKDRHEYTVNEIQTAIEKHETNRRIHTQSI
jgi:hypothetical protein